MQRAPTDPPCRLCHRAPAASATLHQHRGLMGKPRHRVLRGPLCRQCGLIAWRRMTLDTAALGWWGVVSVVVTPLTLALNAVALVRLLQVPATAAVPAPVAAWGPWAPQASSGIAAGD